MASLEDEAALTLRDPYSGDEDRWVTIGLDALRRILVVIYTWRGEKVRREPISQLNIRIPAGISAGNQALQIQIDGIASPPGAFLAIAVP